MNNAQLYDKAVNLLKALIAIPSVSKEEDGTADLLGKELDKHDIPFDRTGNNLIARNLYYDAALPTLLLNSHHDTVKPNPGYTRDPYYAEAKEGKLFGLGSNDAGGALVSLLMVFIRLYKEKLPYNLLFVASAEEEISGQNGISSVLPLLGDVTLAIVGEPTEMQLAVAEKGLMVIDCVAKGKAGHAARRNGENAIEKSLQDLQWLSTYRFDKQSVMLGEVNMAVTQINAGSQHNVIPEKCEFVVDVRTTDAYSNEEVLQIIREHLNAEAVARSVRLQPSGIAADHPIVTVAQTLGVTTFGSPTLSDQALMPFDSVKIGPGKSERSHTADEYIYLKEIEKGIDIYLQILKELKLS